MRSPRTPVRISKSRTENEDSEVYTKNKLRESLCKLSGGRSVLNKESLPLLADCFLLDPLGSQSIHKCPVTNLLEIKMLLVEVQASVSSILHEQKGFKTQLADVKASLYLNKTELKELKESLKTTTDSFNTLKQELMVTRARLITAWKDLSYQQEELYRLGESLNNLEQYARKSSLEIHGVAITWLDTAVLHSKLPSVER